MCVLPSEPTESPARTLAHMTGSSPRSPHTLGPPSWADCRNNSPTSQDHPPGIRKKGRLGLTHKLGPDLPTQESRYSWTSHDVAGQWKDVEFGCIFFFTIIGRVLYIRNSYLCCFSVYTFTTRTMIPRFAFTSRSDISSPNNKVAEMLSLLALQCIVFDQWLEDSEDFWLGDSFYWRKEDKMNRLLERSNQVKFIPR